jgi:cellulose synthase/poly-beta-1,6-N-acetylglucosamine synthase-like glycosyltransferase
VYIVALIPAHNEAGSIAATLHALFAQDRIPDRIVVIPNGCSDDTAEIARQFPIVVEEHPQLPHRKSEALNIGWRLYAQDADVIICLDADTILPPNAVRDWEAEFIAGESRRSLSKRGPLGGSSSKFTMLGDDFLTRLQRAEFARWTDTALRRGWTSVLAGTGCAISAKALRSVVAITGNEGPWAYTSQVEDFELTYQIRKLGYYCQVSPTVRAYTDSMKTVKALWGQRMKWQVGTVEDLLAIGINRLTLIDWWQQFAGLFAASVRILWVLVMGLLICINNVSVQPLWLLAPIVFTAVDIKAAFRIPHRDKRDIVMSFLLIPSEIFATLRAGWFVWAWWSVLISKLTGERKDRWQLQYIAEGSSTTTPTQ